jgi:putative acetyltransferase
MIIRPATPADTAELLDVERAAFGGNVEADLVRALLEDPTAPPLVNLVAVNRSAIVGHVLFSHASVVTESGEVEAALLAPLAVEPGAQGQGIGQALCRRGLEVVGELDTGLVFVLGHEGYYPKLGFAPALPLGFRAPYPIDPSVSDAWMVLATRSGLLGTVTGIVRCARTLMVPGLWAE